MNQASDAIKAALKVTGVAMVTYFGGMVVLGILFGLGASHRGLPEQMNRAIQQGNAVWALIAAAIVGWLSVQSDSKAGRTAGGAICGFIAALALAIKTPIGLPGLLIAVIAGAIIGGSANPNPKPAVRASI